MEPGGRFLLHGAEGITVVLDLEEPERPVAAAQACPCGWECHFAIKSLPNALVYDLTANDNRGSGRIIWTEIPDGYDCPEPANNLQIGIIQRQAGLSPRRKTGLFNSVG
jgi:hypothetical protein